MINLSAEPLLDHRCVLGEGVQWSEQLNAVVWLDIEKGEIHEYTMETKDHRFLRLNQMVGTIVPTEDGNYLAAMEHGFGRVDRASGTVEVIIDPEADLPGNRFNDGKCDPEGRFWAGTIAFNGDPNVASLYVLHGDYSYEEKIGHLTNSNGLAWDMKKNLFYFIDTPTREVVAYDYDQDTGNISNKRVVVEIPKGEGYPDGMTIDREGMLWVAQWGGWQVGGYNPDTGEKLAKIDVPAECVSCCAFGGKEMGDLFITTASRDLTKEGFKKQPLAGQLFTVKNVGSQGDAPYPFKATR